MKLNRVDHKLVQLGFQMGSRIGWLLLAVGLLAATAVGASPALAGPTPGHAVGAHAIGSVEAVADYGDAPSIYGTPSHTVPSPVADARLYFGEYTVGSGVFDLDPTNHLDTEATAQTSSDATGDDVSGIDDEDAMEYTALLGTARTRIKLAYASADPSFNNPNPIDPTTIQVCAWMDGTGGGSVNNTFESAEGQCQTADFCRFNFFGGPPAFLCTFDWTGVPANTFARFRVSTDALTTADGGGSGIASDGEIEDYRILQETGYDGGDAPGSSTAFPVDVDGVSRSYLQAPHLIPSEGSTYWLGANEPDVETADLSNVNADGDDNDGSPDDEDGVGSIAVSPTAGTVTASGVIVNNPTTNPVALLAWVDAGQGIVGQFGTVSDKKAVTIPVAGGSFSADPTNDFERGVNCAETPTNSGIWTCSIVWNSQDDIVLAPSGTTYLRFRVTDNVNNGSTVETSDGEAEDYRVVFTVSSDFDSGDSPASYGDAYHRVPLSPELYLGAVAPDVESISPYSTDATGDNSVGTDDEEGVTLGSFAPVLAQPGYFVLTPTIKVTIPSGYSESDPVALCGWLDSDLDGLYRPNTGQEGICIDVTTDNCGPPSSNVYSACQFLLKAENGTGEDTTFARFRVSSGRLGADDTTGGQIDGEAEDYSIPVPTPLVDYGDAPSGYGEASHVISHKLYLGSYTEDGEPSSIFSVDARGDDDDQNDDEDGVASFPSPATINGTYDVSVAYHNTTGGSARLCGWIDFDKSKSFDTDERACATVGASGTQSLSFTVPADADVGNESLFARFRLATVAAEAESPTGKAAIGEVEDYLIEVVVPVTLASFDVTVQSDGSVWVTWETATEIDHAGFNVYRSNTPTFDAAAVTQLNAELIAGQAGFGQGASYALVDDVVSAGVWYYFLEDVALDGTTTLHGPVSADTSAPTSTAFVNLDGGGPAMTAVVLLLVAVTAIGSLLLIQRRRRAESHT